MRMECFQRYFQTIQQKEKDIIKQNKAYSLGFGTCLQAFIDVVCALLCV